MLTLLLSIVILGVIAWAIGAYTPIPQGFKTLVYIVCIIVAIVMAARFLGISI